MQIRPQICVCGHKPPLSGKQRARKSPCSRARLQHRHLLQRSDSLLDTSVTASPAPSLLSLVNGGDLYAAVDAIRHRTRFMPAKGRKASAAFTGRVNGSVVGFHWTFSSLRNVFSHLVGLLAGSAAPGLKPPPCPHCSQSILFSSRSVCGSTERAVQ